MTFQQNGSPLGSDNLKLVCFSISDFTASFSFSPHRAPRHPSTHTQTCCLSPRIHLFLASATLGSFRQRYKTQNLLSGIQVSPHSRPRSLFPISFPNFRARVLWFIESILPADCVLNLPILICVPCSHISPSY